MKNFLKPRIYERFPTIAAFSLAAKIRENRVSQIITGRLKPSEAEKQIMANTLGCQPDELFPAS